MRRIICVCECALDIMFEGDIPVSSTPGGRIINAAVNMARNGLPVVMASEASADPIGDILVNFLEDAGVDTSSVDRFTQGSSPLMIYTKKDCGSLALTRYDNYGDGGFDIVWPRIDDTDIVLYGGYYVLDHRMRQRMIPFLNHCAERKATMIYVPGFPQQLVPRITRVMPEILENFELADMIITHSSDLQHIFGNEEPSRCYVNHVDFYCRSLINFDGSKVEYFTGKESSSVECNVSHKDMAASIAGIASKVRELNLNRDILENLDPYRREELLNAAKNKNE